MAPEEILLRRIRALIFVSPVLALVGFFLYTQVAWNMQREQPIAFSHKLHAGTRGIDCEYCHRGVSKANNAGVPSVTDCWNCHQGLIKPGSAGTPVIQRPEVQKLIKEYVEAQKDISWFKNYDLPEHVKFPHRCHINAKIDCAVCHGQVRDMAVISNHVRPGMGWCIECHRSMHAPVDCTSCHY